VVLGALLGELGWSPSLLAEAMNGLLGPGYVARSTVSDWLHHDRLPRGPLPTVVAHLISDALGREVGLEELRSGRAKPAELWVPADAGMNLPRNAAGTVKMLDDWLGHTGGAIGMDRRFFPAVSGGVLTVPAWAGWLAPDTGKHGLSQRYFTSGLHAARTAGDRSVGVYLLVCMSSTAVHRGRLADGIDLGRAARDAVELPMPRTRRPGRPPPRCVRWPLAGSRWPKRRRGMRAASTPPRTRSTPCLTPRARWTPARST
jgi:hypothetical protein